MNGNCAGLSHVIIVLARADGFTLDTDMQHINFIRVIIGLIISGPVSGDRKWHSTDTSNNINQFGIINWNNNLIEI